LHGDAHGTLGLFDGAHHEAAVLRKYFADSRRVKASSSAHECARKCRQIWARRPLEKFRARRRPEVIVCAGRTFKGGVRIARTSRRAPLGLQRGDA
jgi:hypothetical protein